MVINSHSDEAIKKVVIVGGLVLMIFCFILVLIFNIDDVEDHEQVIAFSIAIIGIVFFGVILLFYIRSQLKKPTIQTDESDMERSEEVRKIFKYLIILK